MALVATAGPAHAEAEVEVTLEFGPAIKFIVTRTSDLKPGKRRNYGPTEDRALERTLTTPITTRIRLGYLADG